MWLKVLVSNGYNRVEDIPKRTKESICFDPRYFKTLLACVPKPVKKETKTK